MDQCLTKTSDVVPIDDLNTSVILLADDDGRHPSWFFKGLFQEHYFSNF